MAKRENLPESLIIRGGPGPHDHSGKHQSRQLGADGDRHLQQMQGNANIGACATLPCTEEVKKLKLAVAVTNGGGSLHWWRQPR